jgi:hypothetical protein
LRRGREAEKKRRGEGEEERDNREKKKRGEGGEERGKEARNTTN